MARSTARLFALTAAMLLALPGAASAEPPPVGTFTYTSNMQPLGASLYAPPSSGIYNSDLAFWGTRAYQGTYDGFRIINVANPADPQAIINYRGCPGDQGDVIIWGNTLIRSWNSPATQSPPVVGSLPQCGGVDVPAGFEGLHIFDVTIPGNPVVVGSVDLPCGSHTATGVPDLTNERLLVYSSASSSTCPWIDIVEVPLASPQDAKILGTAPSGRSCHDTAVILEQAMLAACAGGNGVTTFSLGGSRGGTLTVPKLLKSRIFENVSIGHAASFSWSGDVLLFGHEPGGGGDPECQTGDASIKKTLFLLNPVDLTDYGTWVLPRPQDGEGENCTIHNFNVVPSAQRRVVVMGNYQSGISVVDFTIVNAAKERSRSQTRLPSIPQGSAETGLPIGGTTRSTKATSPAASSPGSSTTRRSWVRSSSTISIHRRRSSRSPSPGLPRPRRPLRSLLPGARGSRPTSSAAPATTSSAAPRGTT